MRTSFSEKSLFGFIPMEYDYLKARKFWLWAALIFSYLEKNSWKLDVGMLASEAKLEPDFVIKRIQKLEEDWLLVWKRNRYKLSEAVSKVKWATRIRK